MSWLTTNIYRSVYGALSKNDFIVKFSKGIGFSFMMLLLAMAIFQLISLTLGAACIPFFNVGLNGTSGCIEECLDMMFLSHLSKILLVFDKASSSAASVAVIGLLDMPSRMSFMFTAT